MRQHLTSLLLGLSGLGCATGAPVGARATLAERYEPFSRPAAARAIPAPEAPKPSPLVVRPGARDAAVSTARALLGRSQLVVAGRRFGDDCTGLVRAALEPLGLPLMSRAQAGDNAVTAIWRFAAQHGRVFQGGQPVPGDLVFFRETYDLNRDGRRNDGLTHVGLVEAVEADGTVAVIHRVARGVVRYRMNLAHPGQHVDGAGRRLNDWLRTEAPGARPHLIGELFAGYATLLPVEPRLAGR